MYMMAKIVPQQKLCDAVYMFNWANIIHVHTITKDDGKKKEYVREMIMKREKDNIIYVDTL